MMCSYWFLGPYFVALFPVPQVLSLVWLAIQFAWEIMTIDLFPKVTSILDAAKVTACELWEGATGFSVQLPDSPTTILAIGAAGGALGAGAALMLYSYALA
jgi:hypothetical protein